MRLKNTIDVMALLSLSPDKINLKIEINNFPIHASYNNIFTHLFTRFCHKLLFKETFSPLYKREIQILPFYVLFIPRSRIINLQCNNHPPLLPQLLPQRTEQLTFPYLTPSCMRRWQHARKKKGKKGKNDICQRSMPKYEIEREREGGGNESEPARR